MMATKSTSPARKSTHSRSNAFVRAFAVVALIASLVVSASPLPAEAQQPADPSVGDTARLLGYLWADGSYSNGVWDATGPSGGSEIIERLVIRHGGTWIDRLQLKFTLPAPFDWAEWKGSLPNDDARTREAVRHPHFLAALLEGEGSIAGLVYDQSSCCTAGFTGGRLTELRDLLIERGFATTELTMFADADSGRIDIDASEFRELRAGHQFVCPATGAAIRVPGAQNFADHGPIRWFKAGSDYGDVVRTDCVNGQNIPNVGPPVGDCLVTSDGNGKLRLTWTFQRGTVAIRRSGTFVVAMSGVEKVFVDTPSAGTHSYSVRVTADGLRTDMDCGEASTTDAKQSPPLAGETCMGRIVTHLGTGDNDIIDGTPGVDVMHGFGGNDLIRGFGQNDFICAGGGNDRVRGGYGHDTIRGGSGNDRIDGGPGADVVSAGDGDDLVYGRRGPDTLKGEGGADILRAGDGFDTLFGGQGIDVLRGGSHRDTCTGGWGIDRIFLDCETSIQ